MSDKKMSIVLTRENKEQLISFAKNNDFKFTIEKANHMENHEAVVKAQIVFSKEKEYQEAFRYCEILRKFQAQDEIQDRKKNR